LVAATPDVSAITATISSLNTQLTKLNASKSEENMLASRVKQADDALKQIMEAKNPHTANITQLEKTLSETRKTFKELKESMGEAKARHELLERAKAVYAPSGVRSHILASITPFLNAKTSEYLSTLSDGNITAEWSTMEKRRRAKFVIASTSRWKDWLQSRLPWSVWRREAQGPYRLCAGASGSGGQPCEQKHRAIHRR
jgi:DNA repair exonuclease SbcCD ATPase subunit